jgi:hypothetical protein
MLATIAKIAVGRAIPPSLARRRRNRARTRPSKGIAELIDAAGEALEP